MRPYSHGIVLLLLAIPGALAQFPGDDIPGARTQVSEYHIESFNNVASNIATPQTIFTHTFDASKLHNTEAIRHELIYAADLHISSQLSSNGRWRFHLQHDGTDVPGCTTDFPTINPGTLGGAQISQPSITMHCARLGGDPLNNVVHNHTVGLRVSIVSGTPNTFSLDTSIDILRQDTIVITMSTPFETLTGLSAAEFAIFPLMAFVGIFVWSRSLDVVVRAAGSGLVLLSFALLLGFALSAGIGSVWVGTIAFAILLGLVGAYLMFRLFFDVWQENAA